MGIRAIMWSFVTCACLVQIPIQGLGQTTLPQAFELTGELAGTHDPSIAEDHGNYYVFTTGTVYARPAEGSREKGQAIGQLPIRCSDDLHAWKRCGVVFPSIPAWIKTLSPKTSDLWAPDVSYFYGLYHLYYAFSVFGKNTSGIALATNETLDPASPNYLWVDRGLVLQSKVGDSFNAIDPNLILDAKGEAWLSFGSFWTGIKMRHLDRRTGMLSAADTKFYSLASRAPAPPDNRAIEAPFVFRHGEYFYLFVSWDLCCRGLNSTYKTMVGRSKNVTGPYLDRNGLDMMRGGGSPLLQANGTWLGPGGESLMHLPGEDIIVFHAYSAVDGKPSLQISSLAWKEGWPSAMLQAKP